MNLTPQQQRIFDFTKAKYEAKEPVLILIPSVAGAGKTWMLTHIAKNIEHTNGLYCAYNKSIATESARKFPSTTNCLTTHSLAYRAVVTPNKSKYKLGWFNHRTIKESIRYEQKYAITEAVKEFCLSGFTDFSDFAADRGIGKTNATIATKYLGLMEQGKIDITHEFYLKLFHILLANGELSYDPFDFVMIDEAGDLNEVTLEIFKLLPSNIKIAVGDPYQNIYTFNHTINCFDALALEGTTFRMSTSFRVSASIASQIQNFCRKLLDPTMEFTGITLTDTSITSRAYISRTNSSLIEKMIELNTDQVPYGLVRKASEIFKLPLMLASMKQGGFLTDPNYKFLQAQFDEWYDDPSIREIYKTPLGYVASLNDEDIQLSQAIRVIAKHGKSLLFDTYTEAANHESSNHNLTLTTAHSSKGLEFDEVVLDYGLNDMLTKVIDKVESGDLTTEDLTYRDAVNLYYVASSRAKKSLINANHLNTQKQLV